MRAFALSLALLITPTAAQAATFELRDLAGCKLPVQAGAKAKDGPAPTFENGNVVLDGKGLQHSIFWFPGASAELTEQAMELYADVLRKSGAVVDTAKVQWTTVDGTKAARLPVRMSANQPVDGLMLLWASVSTGRMFLYAITPAWTSGGKASIDAARLEALVAEAAGLASCAGAGKVAEPLAFLDPIPPGYGADTTDLPRITYVRKDGLHVGVLWRTPPSVLGRGSCLEPAEPLFERFGGADARLAYADEAEVEIDNLAGGQPGAVCDVVRPVTGLSAAAGGRARYRLLRCAEQDGLVSAFELLAGDAGDVVDVAAARCADALPTRAPPPKAAEPDKPKTQWVPGR